MTTYRPDSGGDRPPPRGRAEISAVTPSVTASDDLPSDIKGFQIPEVCLPFRSHGLAAARRMERLSGPAGPQEGGRPVMVTNSVAVVTGGSTPWGLEAAMLLGRD